MVENNESLSSLLPKGVADVQELCAGALVHHVAQLGKGDMSDWVELMEAVEALCPVWPARVPGNGSVYKM